MIDTGIGERVALVTGANHGIGAACAAALAAQGAAVFLTYLRYPAGEHRDDPAFPPAYDELRARTADSVVAAIRAGGGRAEAWEADLAAPGTAGALFDRAEAAFGPVEILVNNADSWAADTFLPGRLDRFGRRMTPVSAATHDRHFAVNSRAAALLIAELARRHRERGASWGRIISLTTGGARGFAEEVSYGASKNALESYTVAAALELGGLGITANVLCPPPTDTGWITAEMEAPLRRLSPFDHVGQPHEVAEVVVFLASHRSRYITGQTIIMR
jgi:3-oxoacyl-[acyl-carrier protein] reductase